MSFKVTFALVSAIMLQATTGQYLRAPYPTALANDIVAANIVGETLPLAYPAYGPLAASTLAYEPSPGPGMHGLTFGLSLAELSASNGGGLLVTSSSPIPSTGVTVETDKMTVEGPLAVTGQVPFLGVVALEGPLPASGTGSVAYECGNGNIGIVSESVDPTPYSNVPLAPVYTNGPVAPAYPNLQLAPAFANAGPARV